jgi:hypothetical protein
MEWNRICLRQGPIKGFVGPRLISSEGPFGNWKSIVATTVYSRLSGLMEGEGMNRYLRNTDNRNFIFYTPTGPLARHRLRNELFSHTSHFTGKPIVELWFLKKDCFLEVLYFVLHQFSNFFILYFYLSPSYSSVGPKNAVDPRHSAYIA